MHRSSWELEVYARDFQERRQHEAARQRRAGEAAQGARDAGNPFDLGAARLLSKVKSWFSSGRSGYAPGPAQEAPAATEPATFVWESARPARSVAADRRAAPYADMVVVARGPVVELDVVEPPSVVRDC